ncbi:malate dehydrogenase, glyoxysomal-like [Aristolochia californica]|uniref:malate dehydrogenase, glyoxysomal-like n=1 Tax=Aristolochia californica TaxID=171875 RepID=UPI0035DA1A7C
MEETSTLRRSACRAKGGSSGFKVAILGDVGGIGQPLAMLMKMNPLVSVLHLYDVVNAPGVTVDVSHMDTGAVETRNDRDDLFKINAGIVRTLCEGIVKSCRHAIVNLISNSVNSTVPIAAEVFKKAGTYDPKRLLGVTTLDVVRADTFVIVAAFSVAWTGEEIRSWGIGDSIGLLLHWAMSDGTFLS